MERVLATEAAAVGPIEKDGSAFLLLFSTQRDFVFKLNRDQLSRLQHAIVKALRNTAADA
jgi:hypothetical protein